MQEKQQSQKENGMKKTKENIDSIDDELLPEYEIDYSTVKRNPYFKKTKMYVEIDEDIVKAFESSENINKVLKSIVNSLPKSSVAVL